jgi:hypothetical protein
MKVINTGKIIKLTNIDDVYSQINIGDHFYNFVRDIVNNEYEVINIKYIFYSIDPDDIDENGKMHRYSPKEVSKKDFIDPGMFCGLTGDDGGISIIELTIKNVSTGEIFIDESEDEYSSNFMEWSSKNYNDAFDLADLYFKTFVK